VEEIKTVLLWRAEARKRGEWSTSDEIREWLRRAGVAVEDTREGFYWKYKST
jgi:cysteinyl-tRNA synthetase